MQIQWRQQDGHFKRVVVRLISGRPRELSEGVTGFRKRHNSPPTQKKNSLAVVDLRRRFPWSVARDFTRLHPRPLAVDLFPNR